MVFFADRMYELRNEKGYTREELASQLGCLPKMIQDYEEGKLYPHAITMVDIADFLMFLGLSDGPHRVQGNQQRLISNLQSERS